MNTRHEEWTQSDHMSTATDVPTTIVRLARLAELSIDGMVELTANSVARNKTPQALSSQGQLVYTQYEQLLSCFCRCVHRPDTFWSKRIVFGTSMTNDSSV